MPAAGVWPENGSLLMAFLLGLLLPAYTVDRVSTPRRIPRRETRSAAVNVPKGMLRSVFWSFLFGYIMVCAFVLADAERSRGREAGRQHLLLAARWLGDAGPR